MLFFSEPTEVDKKKYCNNQFYTSTDSKLTCEWSQVQKSLSLYFGTRK